MTQVNLQAPQKVGKETTEKMSLQTTAREVLLGTMQTWRGAAVRSRRVGEGAKRGGGSGDWKSSVADSRQTCMISDDDDAERR